MKVFISWSGERSGKVAEQLREWLSYLFESIEPWVSRSDIEAGARWSTEIQEELASTSFGILCLTQENVVAPWILFEAGALAKTLSDTFVVPYLLDLRASEIPGGPLTQFQAKFADRQGTWELVRGINAALKEKGREQDKLSRIFERWWPDLEKALSQISSESAPVRTPRPIPEMVEEILVAVRGLERRLPAIYIKNLDLWDEMFDGEHDNDTLPSKGGQVNLFAEASESRDALRRYLTRKQRLLELIGQYKKDSETVPGVGMASTGEESQ